MFSWHLTMGCRPDRKRRRVEDTCSFARATPLHILVRVARSTCRRRAHTCTYYRSTRIFTRDTSCAAIWWLWRKRQRADGISSHLRALAGEAGSCGRSDAACSSRDNCDLPIECPHGVGCGPYGSYTGHNRAGSVLDGDAPNDRLACVAA